MSLCQRIRSWRWCIQTTDAKAKCRLDFKARRLALTLDLRKEKAHALASHWQDFPLAKEAKHVAAYRATAYEIDTVPLIKTIWQRGLHCYLPRIDEIQNTLLFTIYQPDSILQVNRFGIEEPTQHEAFPVLELDIVLLPLLAFDRVGTRLGFGGGYYDRTLHVRHADCRMKKPLLVGLAFALQESEELLPKDAWDVPLDAVMTEYGWQVFS